MATSHFRDIAKTAILNAIKTDIDADGFAGKLHIYSGTMPATPETVATGCTLLAELPLSYPMGAVTGTGSELCLEFSAIAQDNSANASGTASFARVTRNDVTTVVFDCDISVTNGGGALQLNTTNITVNGPVLVTTFKISVP